MKNNKKGFTIVELVIVIAVIAILAGVLIPTFSDVIKKANFSADQTTVRNMSTVIAVEFSTNPNASISNVYHALLDGGYNIEKMTPKTSNAMFGYDASTKEIGLYDKEESKLLFAISQEAGVPMSDEVYTFVTSEEGLKSIGGHVVVEDITLTNDMEYTSLQSIVVVEDKKLIIPEGKHVKIMSTKNGNMTILGSIIGDVFLNVPNAHVEQDGIICGRLVSEAVANNTLIINGYVEKLSIGTGKYEIAKDGVVLEIDSIDNGVMEVKNNGYVSYIEKSLYDNVSSKTINNGFIGSKDTSFVNNEWLNSLPFSVDIANVEGLIKFSAKTQNSFSPYIKHKEEGTRNSKALNYQMVNVNLKSDIDLKGIKYYPIAAWDAYYQTDSAGNSNSNLIERNIHINFNGNGHSINNLRGSIFGTLGNGSKVYNLNVLVDYDNSDIEDPNKTNVLYKVLDNKIIIEGARKGSSRTCHFGVITESVDIFGNSLEADVDKILFSNLKIEGIYFLNMNNYVYEFDGDGYKVIAMNAFCGGAYGKNYFKVDFASCDISDLFMGTTLSGKNCNISASNGQHLNFLKEVAGAQGKGFGSYSAYNASYKQYGDSD